MEGDSITLHTNLTEIQHSDTILWLFGPKDSLISQITRRDDLTSFFVTDDVEFRGRLQVDQNTGSLTIRNTRIKHSGQYKVTIAREKTTTKKFNVTVTGVVGETGGVKSVSVTEGDSVTLQNHVPGVQRDDLIVWRFGDKGVLLAKIDVETKEISLNDADERFKGRLKLDQTGSLTIMNTRTEHAGVYELQIRGRESSQQFLVSVKAVPDPGWSPAAIVGIVTAVLSFLTAFVAGVVIYYRRKISDLKMHVVEEKSVADGDSVTLKTDTELQKVDEIQWYYIEDNNLIAEISGATRTCDGVDGRFRSKLVLDKKTGDLTINNIMLNHSGLYKLKISGKNKKTEKRFILTVNMRTVTAIVGEDVPLNTEIEVQTDDLLLWTFGAENNLVVKADSGTTSIGARFRERLVLDKTTGSLIMRNITTADSGHFKLQIINSKQSRFKRFNVTVTGE
ncbi:T-lymphocyte surface antigen Ly-9 [Labeo rohita]|uniref:T-lymphocyte surface antigen Ly-9 n=1 Tax=Labeo rohita TaxID=84645 RepID=A0ABQ8LL99_LABRO|nr:T-lymphocyte surface antigen Ly-9 [Labeo rohita]